MDKTGPKAEKSMDFAGVSPGSGALRGGDLRAPGPFLFMNPFLPCLLGVYLLLFLDRLLVGTLPLKIIAPAVELLQGP